MSENTAEETTRDAFFGGRLILKQPARGHRSGTDAVLLAAAVPRDVSGPVCDVGAGVGAVGLGIALLCPAAQVRLLERDAVVAGLARENIDANGMADRVAVTIGDVLRGSEQRLAPARLVVTNPPFYNASQVRASPFAGRRDAHVVDGDLTGWIRACLDLLDSKGTLILIHAPTALPEILTALAGRAGAVTLLFVHPRDHQPARRILVRAVKGSRAPLTVAPPLVLHGEAGFEPYADQLHRGDVGLAW